MAQSDYHLIENYSNAGKMGISFNAISEMLKEAVSDVKHIKVNKVNCEVAKDKTFVVSVSVNSDPGVNVNKLIESVQEKMQTALVNMCEIQNSKVNVKLEGINLK